MDAHHRRGGKGTVRCRLAVAVGSIVLARCDGAGPHCLAGRDGLTHAQELDEIDRVFPRELEFATGDMCQGAACRRSWNAGSPIAGPRAGANELTRVKRTPDGRRPSAVALSGGELTVAGWNQVARWLRRLERLKRRRSPRAARRSSSCRRRSRHWSRRRLRACVPGFRRGLASIERTCLPVSRSSDRPPRQPCVVVRGGWRSDR